MFVFVLVFGLVAGLVYGLAVGLAAGLVDGPVDGVGGGLVYGLAAGYLYGLAFGLMVGLAFGLVRGLVEVWSKPVADSGEASPQSTHHQDAQTQLVFGLVVGLGGGLVFGLLVFGLVVGLGDGLVDALVTGLVFGLGGGLVFGLVFGRVNTAVTELLLAEVVVSPGARRVRFMRLLQTASDRQVLRQAGTVFQFRHADLQDRLAERFAADHLLFDRRGGGPAGTGG